jgi:transposase-like protein
VIQLNNEQYWLYTAVDPETNEVLHITLEPTTNKIIAYAFFAEPREKHNVDDAAFLIDDSHSLRDARRRHSLGFRHEYHGNLNSVECVFREIKRQTTSFSNCFSNAEAITVKSWVQCFTFAYNQFIRTLPDRQSAIRSLVAGSPMDNLPG